MKQTVLLLAFVFIFSQKSNAEEWGKTGHRVIGEVAQMHLTPKAAEQVNTLLEGISLAYVSTYADEIRSDKRFYYLEPWHYVNLNKDEQYHETEKNPEGDIVLAMNTCVEVLKNPSSSLEEKSFYLKLLVHFVGDIHQPLHAGRKQDQGGNNTTLFWFGNPTNLHALWDSDLIDHYQMSYTELAAHLPTKTEEEKSQIMRTSRLQWVQESQTLANEIYENTPQESQLGYEYHYRHFSLVRQRLLEAGLRLAATLNAIFDPAK